MTLLLNAYVALWLSILVVYWQRRNIAGLVFTALVGLYEFPSLLLAMAPTELPIVQSALHPLAAVNQVEFTDRHIQVLFAFFSVFLLSALFTSKGRHQSGGSGEQHGALGGSLPGTKPASF